MFSILVALRASSLLMMFKHARINQQNNHKTLYCHVGTIIIATRRKVGLSLQQRKKKSLLKLLVAPRMPDDPLMHLHNYDTISPDSSWANGGRIINFYSKAITGKRGDFWSKKSSVFYTKGWPGNFRLGYYTNVYSCLKSILCSLYINHIFFAVCCTANWFIY